MSGVPEAVDKHMRRVLETVAETVSPGSRTLVKRHVWRNVDYVGAANDHIVEWRGWSANLRSVDQRFRTVYIDHVTNALALADRRTLFGEVFADAAKDFAEFVFLFVTSCAFSKRDHVIAAGFTYRQINAVIHPGILAESHVFVDREVSEWAEYGVRLLTLQHQLKTDGEISNDE